MIALGLLALACGGSADPAPEPGVPFARDQVFFAGSLAGEPVLAAFVFQREGRGSGTRFETKAFLAWKGAWTSPRYDVVQGGPWPGLGMLSSLDAWRDAGGGRALRVDWSPGKTSLEASLRWPDGGLQLSVPGLEELGDGPDPYGTVAWRGGPATATIDGQPVDGLAIVEVLSEPRDSWPRFGRFEMWWWRQPDGSAALGRQTLPQGGTAVVLRPDGTSHVGPFLATPEATALDDRTGWALPDSWSTSAGTLAREPGQVVPGTTRDGGPAAYDIGLASGDGGAALVFHLQDEASNP